MGFVFVMQGLKFACTDPELRGIDPEQITYYCRRVMVIPGHKGARHVDLFIWTRLSQEGFGVSLEDWTEKLGVSLDDGSRAKLRVQLDRALAPSAALAHDRLL